MAKYSDWLKDKKARFNKNFSVKKNSFSSTFKKVFLGIIIFIFLGSAAFITFDYIYTRGKIYPNFYIERILVGGLTKDNATTLLSQYKIDDILTSSYYLQYGKKDIPFMPSDIGAEGNIDEAVNKAFEISNNENYFRLLYARLTRTPFIISLNFKIADQNKFHKYMMDLAKRINRKEHSAGFVKEKITKKYVIQKEVIGLKLDEKKTSQDILNAIAVGDKHIHMTIEELSPKLLSTTLEKIPNPDLLGTYTTYYGTHDSPNRIHNIKLITHERLNDTVVEPDQKFSIARAIGEFTDKAGFREAFVIIGDELTPELGGGACQTATTLYNTVALADLKVLMRIPHALYFSIYPLGRDAAVYPPVPDMQFVNDTKYPIVLKGNATNSSLTYWIYGEHTGKQVYFTAPVVYASPRKKVATSKTKDKKAKKDDKTVQNPFRTYVQRIVKLNGKVIKTEDIWSSYLANGDTDKIKVRKPEPAYR